MFSSNMDNKIRTIKIKILTTPIKYNETVRSHNPFPLRDTFVPIERTFQDNQDPSLPCTLSREFGLPIRFDRPLDVVLGRPSFLCRTRHMVGTHWPLFPTGGTLLTGPASLFLQSVLGWARIPVLYK